MKKLIMLLITAALTSVVSAASFNWKLQTGTDYTDPIVYAISGTTAAMVFEACKSTDASVWTSRFDGFNGSDSKVGAGSRLAIAGLSTGIAANDNLVFVIVDGEIAQGTTYTVLGDYSIPAANVFEPPATGVSPTIKISDLGIVGTGKFESIPEPTSGLLLLLGGAMLALRRRQK